MSNWTVPTVKQLWNVATHVLHNFLGFNTQTTAFCLGRYRLHLQLLKSSICSHYKLAIIGISLPAFTFNTTCQLFRSFCFSDKIWTFCDRKFQVFDFSITLAASAAVGLSWHEPSSSNKWATINSDTRSLSLYLSLTLFISYTLYHTHTLIVCLSAFIFPPSLSLSNTDTCYLSISLSLYHKTDILTLSFDYLNIAQTHPILSSTYSPSLSKTNVSSLSLSV